MLRAMRTRSLALLAGLALFAPSRAPAQVVDPELFGDGKLPTYREEETDRRFLKTAMKASLDQLPSDMACKKVVATLLTAYADALPYLHRKDQNFFVDPALLATLDRTASGPDFPARAYLAAMIRHTLITKRVPLAWIGAAEKLRKELQVPISAGRMQLFEDGLQPIDSFGFTVPALLDRYAREVKLATSMVSESAEERFRDKYMDRDVAWGGLILHDVFKEEPPPPPKPTKATKRKKNEPEPPPPPPPEPLHTWAVVGFPVVTGSAGIPGVPNSGVQTVQLQIRVRLAEEQYVELEKLPRGSRVLAKGHLWDFGPNLAHLELRDGFLFPDPDWSTWAGTATANDVRHCKAAVNDLSPYGQRKTPGGGPDVFSHGTQKE